LAALSCGGHLRVGMEDTLKLAKGTPVTHNAQLVERAAALATLAQRPPMRPAEGRALLNLPPRRRPGGAGPGRFGRSRFVAARVGSGGVSTRSESPSTRSESPSTRSESPRSDGTSRPEVAPTPPVLAEVVRS